MARQIGKLSPAFVIKTTKPGTYGDGGNLYLVVGDGGTKSWLFRYMLDGRARWMGLGPLHTVGLAEARDRAKSQRLKLLDGLDPLTVKHAAREAKKAEAAAAVTFKAAAELYVKAQRAGWRNEKHAWQWSQTLEAYAYPVIGDLPVRDVDTGHVTKILEPIWATKAETATRVRGRIEAVLEYARTRKWRDGDNPARWKGHLSNLLPPRAKVSKVVHHAALHWKQTGTFMARLSEETGATAIALRFTILTAARTSEVIGAQWREIDLDDKVWTVPAGRMKADKEHRVPLSAPAVALLMSLRAVGEDPSPDSFVLLGSRTGKPLSNMAMLTLLRRIGRDDLTVHGFRSTFRDWAAETGKPNDLAEAALAHTLGDKTQAAYQRGDLLQRRRVLMEEWAEFCAKASRSAEAAS